MYCYGPTARERSIKAVHLLAVRLSGRFKAEARDECRCFTDGKSLLRGTIHLQRTESNWTLSAGKQDAGRHGNVLPIRGWNADSSGFGFVLEAIRTLAEGAVMIETYDEMSSAWKSYKRLDTRRKNAAEKAFRAAVDSRNEDSMRSAAVKVRSWLGCNRNMVQAMDSAMVSPPDDWARCDRHIEDAHNYLQRLDVVAGQYGWRL